MTPEDADALTHKIIAAAMEVHSTLGPGLLESVYEACLGHELATRGHVVEHQVPVAVRYKDLAIPKAFRMDLLIDGTVVVELKSATQTTERDFAQLYGYVKLSRKSVGLLFNFNTAHLRQGIRRVSFVDARGGEARVEVPGGPEAA